MRAGAYRSHQPRARAVGPLRFFARSTQNQNHHPERSRGFAPIAGNFSKAGLTEPAIRTPRPQPGKAPDRTTPGGPARSPGVARSRAWRRGASRLPARPAISELTVEPESVYTGVGSVRHGPFKRPEVAHCKRCYHYLAIQRAFGQDLGFSAALAQKEGERPDGRLPVFSSRRLALTSGYNKAGGRPVRQGVGSMRK